MPTSRRRLTAGACALVAASAAFMVFSGRLRDLRIAVELHCAVAAANEGQFFAVPVRADGGRLIASLAALRWTPNDAARLAVRLYRVADGSNSDLATQAQALGVLLRGDHKAAAVRLDRIPVERRDAAVWTNLAATHAIAATRTRDRDHVMGALVAADRALELEPRLPEALFIRARTLDVLGTGPAAYEAWAEYLRVDSRSPRGATARKRAEDHSAPGDDSAWKTATANLASLPERELSRLVRMYPQQARRYAEAKYAPEWADAVRAGDRAASVRIAARIRIIGETLQAISGDPAMAELAEALDGSGAKALAEAFVTYRAGRLASHAGEIASAVETLQEARELFEQTGSPMAAVAEGHRAAALIAASRVSEAREVLVELVRAGRAASPRNKALLAFALYHLALAESLQGNWSDSLVGAHEAAAIFVRLGERGLAGTAETLLSEAYALLGDEEAAWAHGMRAVELCTAAGDFHRLRVMTAGFARIELRQQRIASARSMTRVERSIARHDPAPEADVDMLLRLAAAESRDGDAPSSARTLEQARTVARRCRDIALRARLLADINGVAGTLTRVTDPERAAELLTAAIEFQLHGQRALYLPRLYLERGRAHIVLGRFDAARDDFERGIRSLEAQRRRTSDPELRSGIFDDTAWLFTEAVSLALDRRDFTGAFRIVERGRARSMLEQIDPSSAVMATKDLSEIARDLPADSVLLEYALLDDRLAIFTLQGEHLGVAVLRVDRVGIERQVLDFMEALALRKPVAEINAQAATLFDFFLRPVQGQLEGARAIVVVPDAGLQGLPFSVLLDRRKQAYLAETNTVITAPSAALFALGMQRMRERPESRTATAAIFANPTLDPKKFGGLAALPASEREAYAVARRYGKTGAHVRAAASVPRFAAATRNAHVIHFGGHCVIAPKEPWRSALLFAPSEEHGGALSVHEIAQMSFPETRVAVLAACSTLRGHTGGVEGVPSVARAFLIAGVPSVIGTLWNIDDTESAVFMRALHDGIAHGDAPAEALRNAQMDALRGPIAALRHPGHWGAFALVGAGSR